MATKANLVHSIVNNDFPLKVTNQTPTNDVIFSDGVEPDYLEFNSGAGLTIDPAARKANLIVPISEA